MIVYQTFPQRINDPTVGCYDTFGIAVYRVNATESRLLCSVSDVFLDRETAEHFAARCTALQLDPAQLSDVLQDTIGVPAENKK